MHYFINGVIKLPNDTIYLPMDSILYPGTKNIRRIAGSYYLDFGNGYSSTFPKTKFIYGAVGNYDASLKYSDSTGKKAEVEQTYIILKREQIPFNDSAFAIFPNLTSGSFIITSKNLGVPDYVEVINMLGNVCYRENTPKMNKFDISNLSPALYIVKVKYGNYIYNKKLVKY